MPKYEVNVCFCTPGKTWHEDTSRAVTSEVEAHNGVQAAIAVLRTLEFDERAEQLHFIHVGSARTRVKQ
ncbi:hypothetical protein [Bradyrhizobium sp. P5_C12]